MHASTQAALTWRRSSFSGDGNNCVEVAAAPAGVGVRDSKNPDGGIIRLTSPAWRRLSARAKAGDLDL